MNKRAAMCLASAELHSALEFGHFWGGNGAVVPKGLPIIARQFTARNTWERSESRRDG